MAKPQKNMGIQQVLLNPDKETKVILEYLCEQSGKLYNNGVYFARQTFFKTLGKLKDRLKQLCVLHGIRFQETEESYTSKASFLDGDSLPKYGEKPDGWKALL